MSHLITILCGAKQKETRRRERNKETGENQLGRRRGRAMRCTLVSGRKKKEETGRHQHTERERCRVKEEEIKVNPQRKES